MENTNQVSGWETFNSTPEFEEGGIYRAIVGEIRPEPSRRDPGINVMRIFFTVLDKRDHSKSMSWLGSTNLEETKEMLSRLGPQALTKPFSALEGVRCEVVVTLKRGICATEIVAPVQK